MLCLYLLVINVPQISCCAPFIVKMHVKLKSKSASWITSSLTVLNQLTEFQEVTICTSFNFKLDNFKSIKVTMHIFIIKPN